MKSGQYQGSSNSFGGGLNNNFGNNSRRGFGGITRRTLAFGAAALAPGSACDRTTARQTREVKWNA